MSEKNDVDLVKAIRDLCELVESINYQVETLNKNFVEYYEAFVKTTNEYTYPNFG